jgi:protein SCO1/2
VKGKRPAITVGIHARMGRVRSLLACVATVAMPILAHAGGVPRFGESPPPSLGGPIDLVDQAGQAFHLSRLSGRSTLVLFGLTHCGTTCPTLLVTAHQVLAASRAEPAVVFVTLDPLNDPPAALRDYLHAFDDRIVGLTGTPGAVMSVAERYGVGVERTSTSVGHSAKWYLLSPAGRLVRVYGSETTAVQLASDLDRVAYDNPGVSR